MKKTSIPKFNEKKDLFKFLVENKSLLIAEKKFGVKYGDAITLPSSVFDKSEGNKAIVDPSTFSGDSFRIKAVINTTNIMDSHSDVHIQGLWNKSLRENKSLYLLQEHELTFKGIISDNINASVKMMNWADVGLNKEGQTQALVFDTVIDSKRNPFMFEQYLKGYVKNHSVGMQYVSLQMAINSKDYATEYENWKKYIDQVINRKEAEDQGYFWAITEAKVREGSAVVIGSNQMTPLLSISDKNEPSEDTPINEPPAGTQTTRKNFYLNKI